MENKRYIFWQLNFHNLILTLKNIVGKSNCEPRVMNQTDW